MTENAERLALLGEATMGGEDHVSMFVADVDRLESSAFAFGRAREQPISCTISIEGRQQLGGGTDDQAPGCQLTTDGVVDLQRPLNHDVAGECALVATKDPASFQPGGPACFEQAAHFIDRANGLANCHNRNVSKSFGSGGTEL